MTAPTAPTARPSVSIAAGRDFYVPAFEVRMLGGAEKLPRDVERDVLQVTYRDDLNRIPTVEITVNNWDVGRRAFKYSDSDLFDPGKQLTVAMGYLGAGGGLHTMINADIVSCRPSFPASGGPTLTITAQHTLMRRLQDDLGPRPLDARTDSGIAEQIAGVLKFQLRTDPAAKATEKEIEIVSQGDESTLQFLLDRAHRIDYELIPEELGGGKSKLYFGPSSGFADVVHKLAWGSTLSEFHPALNTIDQLGSVTVNSFDTANKKPISKTVKRSELKLKTVGTAAAQRAVELSFAARAQVLRDPAVQTDAQGMQVAYGSLRRNAKDLLTSTGSVVGLPDLRAGVAVEIDKVGSRYQGRYVLSATMHTLGAGGYTTQFECWHE